MWDCYLSFDALCVLLRVPVLAVLVCLFYSCFCFGLLVGDLVACVGWGFGVFDWFEFLFRGLGVWVSCGFVCGFVGLFVGLWFWMVLNLCAWCVVFCFGVGVVFCLGLGLLVWCWLV